MGELTSLISMLTSKPVNDGRQHTWSWALASNGLFTVNKLSKLLDEQVLCSFYSQQGTLHNKLVPKKVEILIWRTLRKRLSVKVELDKRGIDVHSVRYPLCDDDLKSVDHALCLCKRVFDIWVRVFSWWGLGKPTSLNLSELISDNNSSSMSSSSYEV
ncbi:uncharacterized protein [Rutidosis leptorrhynchoides]|uniref:uncharacterized protein n=1 Tax=Rutidosis leptorrhynchoides TaxID=125765 RepID=UPI003A9A65C2